MDKSSIRVSQPGRKAFSRTFADPHFRIQIRKRHKSSAVERDHRGGRDSVRALESPVVTFVVSTMSSYTLCLLEACQTTVRGHPDSWQSITGHLFVSDAGQLLLDVP